MLSARLLPASCQFLAKSNKLRRAYSPRLRVRALPVMAAVTESGLLPASFQELNAADHDVFAKYVEAVELRPGRPCQVLHARPEGAAASDKSADVIFFIHGAMATMTQFEFQCTHFLERGYTVVAFDAIGCGTSPKPRDYDAYSFDNAFADVCELVRRFKGRRNVLVGHSYGSSMCMRLAALGASDPSSGLPRADGLVLLGSGIGPDKCPGVTGIFWLPLFILELITPLLRQGFKDRALHESTVREENDVHRRLLARMRAAEGVNPMHMVQACVQQMRWVSRDEVAAIQVPALVISGEGDKITKAEWAQAVADALPRGGEVHILRDASHQVMLEKPETVNALIEEYVKRMLSSPAS